MEFSLSRLFSNRAKIGVVQLHGVISAQSDGLNVGSAGPLLRRAFDAANGRPVILDIESPGGSPVQSDLLAAMIRRLADRAGVRVHAVIREVGASGGYWIACAADEIHANPMSIVGSIGVVGGGFGFPQLLDRLGIERRIYTAGVNKRRLDPFSPERPEDVAFTQDLLDALHTRFKDWVRLRRGNRLTGSEALIFDGGFMLGARALDLGLIDTLNDVEGLVRLLAGERVRIRRFERKRGLFSRLPRMGLEAALNALEEQRFRLDLR